MDDRVKAFLNDLSELSKKHSIYVYSCTCCHNLEDESGERIVMDNELSFNRDTGKYQLRFEHIFEEE